MVLKINRKFYSIEFQLNSRVTSENELWKSYIMLPARNYILRHSSEVISSNIDNSWLKFSLKNPEKIRANIFVWLCKTSQHLWLYSWQLCKLTRGAVFLLTCFVRSTTVTVAATVVILRTKQGRSSKNTEKSTKTRPLVGNLMSAEQDCKAHSQQKQVPASL